MFQDRITDLVKKTLGDYLKEGDIAIDLTAGNGYDTCFLSEKVGTSGRVYAFDIQEKAIAATRKRLEESGLIDRVNLILDGHENLLKYVEEPVHVAMMNLGYLPSGDKQLITQPKSTLKAVEDLLSLLAEGGILSVVVYWGHPGGEEEKETLDSFLKALDNHRFDVMTLFYPNRGSNAPIIHFIGKKRAL